MGFGGGGPSQGEIVATQEAAAKKERERLRLETANKEADIAERQQGALAKSESRRQALVSSVMTDDDEKRRKYLKAA